MFREILLVVSGIVSVYFVGLSIFCGMVCIFYIGPYIKSGGYDTEAAIAKYGVMVYIGGSIGLYIILRIFT